MPFRKSEAVGFGDRPLRSQYPRRTLSILSHSHSMASSSSVGPARLGVLLSETAEYCKAHWQSLALGAVVFGVIMGLVSTSVSLRTDDIVRRGIGQMGIDTQRMEELNRRMEAGDETALAELETLLSGEFEGMNDQQIARKMMGPVGGAIATMLPIMGISMLISWLVTLLAYAYYSLVAVEGKDVRGTLMRMKVAFLPLVGVSLWSMLRSFVWIPIIGIIPAIFLGPRFIAAPLIHLVEGKGVTASVSESFTRTRGYNGKILGNVIAAGILVGVASMVLSAVLSMLLVSLPPVHMVVVQIVSQSAMAFVMVFVIRLAHTILQQPRA